MLQYSRKSSWAATFSVKSNLNPIKLVINRFNRYGSNLIDRHIIVKQLYMIAYLYLQVYTIDKFYQQFSTVGHALLNVFVKSGTERQPTSDDAATQVSHACVPP